MTKVIIVLREDEIFMVVAGSSISSARKKVYKELLDYVEDKEAAKDELNDLNFSVHNVN